MDNLNRATASQDGARSSDILGNTTIITFPGSTQRQFDWDCLNRMTRKRNGATVQATYTYRADGMRTYKNTNNVTTAYRYDGQMGMEDVDTAGSTVTTTDYGMGARGIDWIQKTVGNGTPTVVFPIYDAHGNMVGDLQRGASGTYSVNDERTYDAWGSIRAGAQQNDPKGRYCASLGHKADDETGFIYMRARYYEPSTARFLSEDPDRQGPNWTAYCGCDPVNRVDRDGKLWWLVAAAILGAIVGMAAYYTYQQGRGDEVTLGGLLGAAILGAGTGALALGIALVAGAVSAAALGEVLWIAFATGVFGAGLSGVAGAAQKQVDGPVRPSGANKAVSAAIGEQFLVMFQLFEINNE